MNPGEGGKVCGTEKPMVYHTVLLLPATNVDLGKASIKAGYNVDTAGSFVVASNEYRWAYWR